MAETCTAYLTFAYDGTSFTRKYAFDMALNDSDLFADMDDKIEALNASLSAGTAGGLSSFFLSDDGHNFAGIIDKELVTLEIVDIDLNAED